MGVETKTELPVKVGVCVLVNVGVEVSVGVGVGVFVSHLVGVRVGTIAGGHDSKKKPLPTWGPEPLMPNPITSDLQSEGLDPIFLA